MLLPELRAAVAAANREIARAGLVNLSFGNASGVDRGAGAMVIKASGLPCATLEPEETVVVALADGRLLDGAFRPSSDTPTHLLLYRRFSALGGIVHTHSPYATAWAQAGHSIPCLGTTHADYFHGPVPVTRRLTRAEIEGEYELKTGEAIAEACLAGGDDPMEVPAALVHSHGPFAWGGDPAEAAENAIAVEAVAAIALSTTHIEAGVEPIDDALLERHFWRKHGLGATYGQSGPGNRPPHD